MPFCVRRFSGEKERVPDGARETFRRARAANADVGVAAAREIVSRPVVPVSRLEPVFDERPLDIENAGGRLRRAADGEFLFLTRELFCRYVPFLSYALADVRSPLLGVAAGALAPRAYHAWFDTARVPRHVRFEQMLDRLELNAEQRNQVRQIFDDTRGRLDALRPPMR